jgi:uncharacterized protein YjbI with pentapeptide repeats
LSHIAKVVDVVKDIENACHTKEGEWLHVPDEDAMSLSARWETREGKEKAARILGLFASRKIQSLEKDLGRHNGRVDFRGFRLPQPASKGRLDFHGADVGLIERIEYKRLSFKSCDFSHADLSDVMWKKCSFEDCLFEKTRMVSSSFWDCSISNCTFRECDLTDVVLGGRVGLSSGGITDVEFHDGKFVGVVFSFPRIERCLFDCDIVDVDFDGSQFVDCKFTGKLDIVVFRRKYNPLATDTIGIALMAPENKMKRVDFSCANLHDVDFRSGVDLGDCAFPEMPGVFLILDGSSVFTRVKDVIESSWHGEDRRIGLGFTGNYYLDRIEEGQKHFLIDEELFVKDWGESLGHRYASLVREIGQSLNMTSTMNNGRQDCNSNGG